jgi:hypothetical protein
MARQDGGAPRIGPHVRVTQGEEGDRTVLLVLPAYGLLEHLVVTPPRLLMDDRHVLRLAPLVEA